MPSLKPNPLNKILTIGLTLTVLSACNSNDYDYQITHYDALLTVLKKARPGEKIYIPEYVVIDLSGKPSLKIPAGVTLFSLINNKLDNKKIQDRAHLYSNTLKTIPMIKIMGKNVTLSGLRITGPDPDKHENMLKTLKSKGQYYLLDVSQGISTSYDNLTIINSELSGWSHAAIHLVNSVGHRINYNYIHHNQRWGLGYGIVLDGAKATIEHNQFDWNRHAIAGSGKKDTEYTARYNVIGRHANGHAFDMHGILVAKNKFPIAGYKVEISNNIFLLKQFPAISIRGVPQNKSNIQQNCFSHASLKEAVKTKSLTNINLTGNTLFFNKSTKNACDNYMNPYQN